MAQIGNDRVERKRLTIPHTTMVSSWQQAHRCAQDFHEKHIFQEKWIFDNAIDYGTIKAADLPKNQFFKWADKPVEMRVTCDSKTKVAFKAVDYGGWSADSR